MRDENMIFNDLTLLCASSGYVHVIAYLCYRDNTISCGQQLTSTDLLHQYSDDRLLRTEISTLIGLMFKADIDLALPKQDVINDLLVKTESLLHELHQTMLPPKRVLSDSCDHDVYTKNPFTMGSFIGESIFYGGESAYRFQYKDITLNKYKLDNDWFKRC